MPGRSTVRGRRPGPRAGASAGPGPTGPERRIEPAPSGGWVRRLWPFLRTYRRDVVVALAASVIGQTANGIAPLVQRVIVDGGIVQHDRPVAPWLGLLAVLALVTFGLAYVRRWVGGRVSLGVQHDLRTAIFDRLMRLDFAGHDRLRTGQLVSRASSDLGLVQQLLAFLPIMLGNVVLIVLALVAMIWLSPPLTLVMVVALPLMAVTALRLRTTVFPATWEAQQRAAEVAGVVDEAVTGVRIVKGFGAEQREIRRLEDTATALYRSRVRLVRLQARITSTLSTIPSLAQVAVLALGGWLVLRGQVSLGTFLAFSSYLVQLVAPIRMLALVIAATQQARAGGERILEILDANAEVVDRPGARPFGDVSATGSGSGPASGIGPAPGPTTGPGTGRGPGREVVFDHVRFGYTAREPVLDDCTFTIAPGEVVALVGGSGSGKSTVTALLPRFYDVAAGSITIDGADVREVTLASLRAEVGVVFEEAFLFSASVHDNIAYGRAEATREQVRAAARVAGAERFIDDLPDGFDTVVGERGLTLSGGQRQRIALARAVVSDPAVLVLDDATSAVDTTTEEAIHQELRAVMAGRTTILVAHRASTVRLAGRVLLLERGRVVDEGTHDELLARSAPYRALLGDEADGATPAETPAGPDGITAAAWPAVDRHGLPVAAAAPSPTRGVTGAPGGGGFGSNLAATPQLLAALDRLPPADDDPHVDLERAAAEPPEPFRVLRFVLPWRSWMLVGLALVALDAGLTVLGPFLIRHGIDAGVGRRDESVLWTTAAVFLAVDLLDWWVMWAVTWVTGRTAERMLLALRVRVFAHLQRLSLDYYDNELAGRVMTRMTNDIDALAQLVQGGLVNAVVGGATCVGVAVFLVVLSPPLALAAAAVLPFLVAATWWYQRRSSHAYRQAREAIADVNANLQENLSGVRVTQAYGRQGRNLTTFRETSGTYLQARLQAQRLLATYFPSIGLFSDLAAVAVLAAGVTLVGQGRVTPAIVVAFVLYLNLFFSPIQQLSQVFDTWQQAGASTAKITELLTTASSTPLPAVPVPPGRLRGALELRDVHLRYGPDAPEALRGVDLRIEPGETVALVGETGAGKSTIVKLFARFHDPTEGVVLADGIDLRTVELTEYRRQLGVVPQEPFLFTGTVRDNIAYGRPEASDAAVEAAARAVGAHPFICDLPAGYRTAISERGRSLSAGQRQLLALARAQLVDPAVLLLDEATANLDLHAEARVRAAMSAVAARRTTVLVAHRLPTARTADRIVVLADGRIVETGTHEELLLQRGRYARLWATHHGSSA